MPAPTRTALALAIVTLALPATAGARSLAPDSSGGGDHAPATNWNAYGAAGVPVTPGTTGTTSRQDLRSPDAIDAANAAQRSHPIPAAPRPASPPAQGYRVAAADDGTVPWPDVAFAGIVLLASAGGVVRVRLRRSRRVTA